MRFAPSRTNPLTIGIAAGSLFLLLVVILFFFAVHVLDLSGKIEKRNEMLLDQLRDNDSEIEFLKQNLLLLAQDENAVRGAVKLPTEPYPILEPQPVEPAEVEDPDAVYLNGIDTLLRERDKEISEAKFRQLLASPLLAQAARSGGFARVEKQPATVVLMKSGRAYFTLTIDPSSQTVRTTDFLGRQLETLKLDSRFLSFLRARTPLLAAHFAQLSSALARFSAAIDDPGVLRALSTRKLALSRPIESSGGYVSFLTRGGTRLLTVRLDERSLQVTDGAKRYPRVSDFAAGFVADVDRLDLRTPEESRVEEAKAEIVALARDKIVMSTLAARRIRFVTTPREDADYYHYDFEDVDGRRIGSFAVAKGLGGIVLMDSADVPIGPLRPPVDEDLPKKPDAP